MESPAASQIWDIGGFILGNVGDMYGTVGKDAIIEAQAVERSIVVASSGQNARRNPYLGVNAHLQSYAQHNTIGAWKMWHNAYINDIFNALSEQLPSGYEVGMTTSLQISEYHPDSGERIRRPEPDVTIYESDPSLHGQMLSLMAGTAPTLVLPVTETLHADDELYLSGLMIYRAIELNNLVPVTRIEILSPTNKPPGDGFIQYFEKRDATLAQETPLIEIDLLHESRPVPRGIPSYPNRHTDAHPYNIYVNDTRLGLADGKTLVYGFSVDEAFPLVPVPLAGKEHIIVDFLAPYNETYARLQLLRNRLDFQQVPLAFETYTSADQARIQAVMQRIKGSL